mmetsp:Transcript_80863/g.168784  ORF Transcript_80863/g.168784 Transcript_80863/m.168784 type:complete len:203 (-) Transcript_80863:586-1194(-)
MVDLRGRGWAFAFSFEELALALAVVLALAIARGRVVVRKLDNPPLSVVVEGLHSSLCRVDRTKLDEAEGAAVLVHDRGRFNFTVLGKVLLESLFGGSLAEVANKDVAVWLLRLRRSPLAVLASILATLLACSLRRRRAGACLAVGPGSLAVDGHLCRNIALGGWATAHAASHASVHGVLAAAFAHVSTSLVLSATTAALAAA